MAAVGEVLNFQELALLFCRDARRPFCLSFDEASLDIIVVKGSWTSTSGGVYVHFFSRRKVSSGFF